jgi:flagellar basal body-associated protein FliL
MRQEKKNKLAAIFVVLIMVFVAFVVAAAFFAGL